MKRGCYLLLLALMLVASPLLAAQQVSVAVASNFTATMQQLVKQFEQQSGYQVAVSYGSTGKLFAQIVNGSKNVLNS